jgi:hypothetical protein
MNDVAGLESTCRGIRTDLGTGVDWKWDPRFRAALAEVRVDDEDRTLAAIAKHLPSIWDRTNLDRAVPGIEQLVARLGGLMPGQMLLTSKIERSAGIYCAWWPWGNGKTISIRVGVFQEAPPQDGAETDCRIREWFGL